MTREVGRPPSLAEIETLARRAFEATEDAGPVQEAALQEPAPDALREPEDPAGPDARDTSGAGPEDTVLLLTEMIAPDGSVVRLDPRPAETPSPADTPDLPPAAGAGAGGSEEKGKGALDPATQSELAATVREWLDRNAPGLVDRAARRELQKLADRQD